MSGTMVCVGFFGLYMQCQIPETPQTTTIVCPPVVATSAAVQKATAARLKALPPGDPLRRFAQAAVKQQQLVRKCREDQVRPPAVNPEDMEGQ